MKCKESLAGAREIAANGFEINYRIKSIKSKSKFRITQARCLKMTNSWDLIVLPMRVQHLMQCIESTNSS
jgi:hypothetical protein